MTLGKRIAQARRELGVRQQRDVLQSDMAGAVGVGAATVSRWEADQAIPRDAVLEQLAAFLGTTPAYLRYGIPDVKTPASPETGVTTFDPNPELDTKVTDEEHAADEAAYQAHEAARKRKLPRRA